MRRTLVAILLIFSLALTGCTPESTQVPEPTPEPSPSAADAPNKRPFTLSYYSNSSLHPINENSHSTLLLTSLVYEGLFELDNTFTPHKVLCKDYSISDDGLTWTLSLTDAVFSDNTSLTAADVISSLELARNSKLYSQRLSDIQHIRADESGSVVITLLRPNNSLPALLDTPIIRDLGDGSMPLGTGPYRYVEDNGPLRLLRCDNSLIYAPDEIPLIAIDGADDMIYAFDAGEVSLVISDVTGANALGYSSGHEDFQYPTTTMLFVGFQTKKGPCKNTILRQILSRSFDRDTVSASLLAGHGDATCLPFSPHSALYSDAHEDLGCFDPNSVDALSQAGYEKNEDGQWYSRYTPLSLTFVVNTDNSFKLQIAEYLAQQLTSQGITVTLKKLPWEDYLAALTSGDFDLFLGEVTLKADFDLIPLLSEAGTLNYGGYINAETTALLNQLAASTPEQKSSATAAFLDHFQAEAPIAPLCFKSHSILAQWRCVSGLTPTRQNPFYHLESLRFDAVQ